MSDFPTILSGVLNPDKAVRTTSETYITDLQASSPLTLAQYLLQSMALADEAISSLSLVLFRKRILDTSCFSSFPATTQTELTSSLVALVSPTRPLSWLRKLGDILTGIASTGAWAPDFFRLCALWGSAPELKELSLYLLEISVEFPKLLELLESNTDSVVQLLTGFLADANRETVLSAVNTLAALFSGLQEETKVLKYVGLAPTMATALVSTTTGEKLKTTLGSIADLTETCPRFWKDTTGGFVQGLCAIATAQIDPDTRSAAVEVLVTLVQRGAGIVKKVPAAVTEICQTAMTLTYEVDFKDDLEEWTKDETDLAVTNNDPYSLGKDLLSKSAKCLGEETVLPFYLQTIPTLLKDSDWTKQHTAILTVGFIAEGCHERFQTSLSELLTMLTPFATAAHPRLQWAFATTLGLLCSEFEPTIQSQFHSQIMPTLLTIITTSANVKSKTQAVSALVNFTRGLLTDDDTDSAPVTAYATSTLTALAGLLQTATSYKTMNEVLGAVSATATVMEEAFAPYYTQFMPVLKNMVTMTFTTPEQQEVRANCVRCMGHCVESISTAPTEHLADVAGVMSGLVTLKQTLDSDDPTALAINEVVSQFADCLKTEFLPYLEIFVPDLLNKAQAPVDMAFTDADVELPSSMKAVSFDLKGQGTKQIAVNTTALQHKIKACRVLYDLVSSLKSAYAPYVEATLAAMTPLFTYLYNSDIRKYSMKTVVAIFMSQEQNTCEIMLRMLTAPFLAALQSPKSSPKDIKDTLKSLQACLEHTQNKAVIGLATANEIAATTATCVKNVFERKTARKTEMKTFEDPDMYTDEIEAIKEEDETDDKILSGVMEVVGMLLKGFKKEFQTTFLQYFKTLYGEIFFKEGATEKEILAAVCIFDDYVENTQDMMWSGTSSPILEQMLKFATHKNENLRQSAVFGLGLCAQATDSITFAPFMPQTMECIRGVLSDPKARTEKYTVATDCAVGALGKVALFHNNALIEDWLNFLPIKAEVEEARAVHSLMFMNIEKVKGFPRTMTVIQELKNLVKEEEVLDSTCLAMLNQY